MSKMDTADMPSESKYYSHGHKLTYDTNRNLSKPSFKSLLKQETSKANLLSKLDRLKTVPAYPQPYVFASLSSASYTDILRNESMEDYEKRCGLPDDWKILTSTHNDSWCNGYFGAAYYNLKNKQIIVAHRGTNPKNIGSWRSDLQGVYENHYVPQMNSACTFADIICSAAESLEDFYDWQLFFTGHSLGAWLAQITTFSVKYLKVQVRDFVKNLDEGLHVHTEVFDSPGCKDMLLKLAKDFGIVYDDERQFLDTLDMTSYLSSPNLVNCCNYHTGTVYRIYPKIVKDVYGIYTLVSHSIKGILDSFDPKTGHVYRHDNTGSLKMKSVLDWPKLDVKITITSILDWNCEDPILGIEYVDFFKWANTMNDFDPEPDVEIPKPDSKSTFEILYRTSLYREYEFSNRVFTQSELEFLRAFQRLGTDQIMKLEIDDRSYILDQLSKIILEEKIIFSREDNLRFIIPFVKILLRIVPDLKTKVLSLFEVSLKDDDGWFNYAYKSCQIS